MDETSPPEILTHNIEGVLSEVRHVQSSCNSKVTLLFLLDSTTEYNILATKIAEMFGVEVKDVRIFDLNSIAVAIEVFPASSNGVA